MNLEELLAHIGEVKDTLNSNGYFDQLKAMGSNALTNASNAFPAMTKKDPTIEDLLNTGLNFAAPLNIKAWHGSPHKFTKFSDEAIGTGEGAQAFGMGHYSGENAPLLDSYYRKRLANNISPQDFHKQNPDYFDNWYKERAQKYADQYDWGDAQPDWGKVRYEAIKDFDSLLGAAIDSSSYLYNRPGTKFSDTANFMMNWVRQQQKNPGYLYELNLKPDLQDLLNWDRPVGEQSENIAGLIKRLESRLIGTPEEAAQKVKAAVDGWRNRALSGKSGIYDPGEIDTHYQMMLDDPGAYADMLDIPEQVVTNYHRIATPWRFDPPRLVDPEDSISDLHKALAKFSKGGFSTAEAHKLLKNEGIPGHYFAGEGGKGLNNFVMYDPADIEIIRRIRGGFDSPMQSFVDYLRKQSMNKVDQK